jgi:hypothetical protein
MDAHMEGISSSIIVQAVNGLTAEYPKPSMVHLSTLPGTPRQQDDTVLVATIFAAHTAQPPQSSHIALEETLRGRSSYEDYAESLLSALTFSSPNVLVVQALPLMAALKGGSGELNEGWMHCGGDSDL